MTLHDELVELIRHEGSATVLLRKHALNAAGRCSDGCGGTALSGHGARGECSIYRAAKAATEVQP